MSEFLGRVIPEHAGDLLPVDALSHDRVLRVTQVAHHLGGDHLVEHRNDALDVGSVRGRDWPLFQVLQGFVTDTDDVDSKVVRHWLPPGMQTRTADGTALPGL